MIFKPVSMPCRVEVGTATSVGKTRSNNEDAYLSANPLFAVADGMGGHEAGEIASKLAIDTLRSSTRDLTDPANLCDLVMQANNDVLEAPQKGIGRVGMGTTLTAAVLDNNRLLIAQVGDSRAYLLHDDRLRRLTRDHSYVQELVNSGEISEDETRDHPRRSVITRVLGFEPNTQPDIYEVYLEEGDRMLLCSDGLHGMIDDLAIASIMREERTPALCANALVRAANKAGGLDNTTVVVVEIQSLAPVQKTWLSHLKNLGIRRGVIGFLLALALLVGGAATGVWMYAKNAAYVIAEDGQVVVYRGLVGDVMGIRLQWRVEETGIVVDDLSAPLPERLDHGIQLRNMDEAEQLVNEYRQQTEKPK